MQTILVVEDSPMVMKVLKHVFSSSEQFKPVYAMSFKEAQDIVESGQHAIFASLVDLNLPDAPNGEVVDYVLAKKIPAIVLTGSFEEQRRETLLAKGIVDYVTKEGKFSYIYALAVLSRLVKNQKRKILVVDDSSTQRKFIKSLLQLHLFQVLEADDGVTAIKQVVENPDISLLITDFNMPRMDGCELVKHLRVKYEKTDLVIIGLSSEGEGTLSARFIKNGANDFLRKPFNHEEFYCRVSHNLELLELVEEIRDSSYRDDLTNIRNRKYFFERGAVLLDDVVAKKGVASVAILDLDGFDEVNAEYGNAGGNQLLIAVASQLNKLFERFVIARASGNMFYVLMPGLSDDKANEFVNRVRSIVGDMSIDVEGTSISTTFSAGIAALKPDDVEALDGLIHRCLAPLKRAKEAGGDLVFIDD